MTKLNGLVAIFACSMLGATAFASSKAASVAARTPSNINARGGLGQPDAAGTVSTKAKGKKKSKPVEFSGQGTYQVISDMADQVKPRLYSHRIRATAEASFMNQKKHAPNFSLGAMFDITYRSVGTEIDGRQQAFNLSDTTVYGTKDFQLGKALAANHILSLSSGSSFPSSVESQYEGYKAVPFMQLTHVMAFDGQPFSLFEQLDAQYIVNTYEYSPARDSVNPNAAGQYTLGGSVRIGSYVSMSAMGSIKSTHHLDGSNVLTWSNMQFLAVRYQNYMARLIHINGSHVYDRAVNLWFIDEYRRIVGLELGYGF